MKKKFIFNTTHLINIEGYEGRINKEINIFSVSAANNPNDNTLIFISNINDEILKKIQFIKDSLIIVNENLPQDIESSNLVLKVEKPRREYGRILRYMLDTQINRKKNYNISPEGYVVGDNVHIGEGTRIEPFAFIEDDCNIGDRCVIRSGARIRANTTIGNDCIISENTVIGEVGFGMERDEDGKPYRIPHLGGVLIGNSVEVGVLVSIVQGTIEPTVIEDYVKIDDCVFIAHNCIIEESTYIIANAEISGGVHIGKSCWIGPSTSIIDNISIGNNVTTGVGAVIIKDVLDNEVVAGNPADSTQNLKKLKNIRENLLKLYS